MSLSRRSRGFSDGDSAMSQRPMIHKTRAGRPVDPRIPSRSAVKTELINVMISATRVSECDNDVWPAVSKMSTFLSQISIKFESMGISNSCHRRQYKKRPIATCGKSSQVK